MYPWRHFQYGGSHQAVCSGCTETISTWAQPWGELRLPSTVRKAVNTHLKECA